MFKIKFLEKDIEALEYERYNYPHPVIQKKMEVLYLKSQGLPHKEIRRLCKISKTTLSSYLKQYLDGGIGRLKELNYQGQPSKLLDHLSTIEKYFKEHPPQTSAQAQSDIERLTGIKRCPTQIRAFLKRLGLRYLKVGFVPGNSTSADKMDEQEKFVKNELKPRLSEANEGKRNFFLWMPLILCIALF